MPNERPLEGSLPKLLTRETMDRLMLGYVLGFRHISPLKVLQVKAAIEEFKNDLGLSEDEFPLQSAIVRFYSLYDDFKAFPDWAGGKKWSDLQKIKRNDKSNQKRDNDTV